MEILVIENSDNIIKMKTTPIFFQLCASSCY